MRRAWLQPFTWTVIVETNGQLCLPQGAWQETTSVAVAATAGEQRDFSAILDRLETDMPGQTSLNTRSP